MREGAASGEHDLPAPTPRSLGIAALAIVLLATITGVAIGVQTWLVFRRFSVELAPSVAALEIVRGGLGAGIVALVACLFVTSLVHARTDHRRVPRLRWTQLALLSAAAVALLQLPTTALALGASLSTMRLLGTSLTSWRRMLEWNDVNVGALVGLAIAVVPLAWTPLADAWMTSPRRGLAFKLFVTWLVLVAPTVCVKLVSTPRQGPP